MTRKPIFWKPITSGNRFAVIYPMLVYFQVVKFKFVKA